MATSASQTDPQPQIEIDRLSSLPEELLITILSLLPTRIATRTSVLSRRFQHLWKASPAVDLSFKCKKSTSDHVDMATSALLSREPFDPPLLRLRLEVPDLLPSGLPHSFISSLLTHAHSLSLRHLTMDGYWHFEPSLRSVFSITSLESLSIHIFSQVIFPSATSLTRLKSLSIHLHSVNTAQVFDRLLSELCCLERLQLTITAGAGVVSLCSLTIKKLELTSDFCANGSVGLFMPSLEFLYLANGGYCKHLPHIHGDIPSLRKSVVTLDYLRPEHVTAVAQLLNCISHVEEISLDLEEIVVVISQREL